MQIATRGRLRYDRDGRLAAQGKVSAALLSELMRQPYLRRRPPKTTGRELFGVQVTTQLYERARTAGLAPADIVATLTAFTAASIADAYRRFLPGAVNEVILCGGGARNPVLVRMLQERLPAARVRIMDELGFNADAKEAVSFAILAWATARGLPGNVCGATGAKRAVVLGKIVPGR